MIFIDESSVRELLRYDELIAAMETALAAFSGGRTMQPLRNVLVVEESRRYMGVMPAVVGDVMGCKIVTFYPVNASAGIPTHNAALLLFRTDTGEPLAAMDATAITEMRTAAVSAAITRRLMPARSRVLALLGSGVQARSHVEALARIHAFEEVRVWSPTRAHAERFAREYGAHAAPDAETAVRGADVVVTATGSMLPVLAGDWLKPGAHVNSVGAARPTWRELDDAAMANTVVVDSREAVLAESGDVIMSGATVYAEIGEIFSGAKAAPAGTTIFKSVGIAVEDIAAAKLVFDAWSRREGSQPL